LTDGDRAEILKNIHGKILHTDKHPKMSFRSTGVTATGVARRYRVTGDLTISGRTVAVNVDLVVMDSGRHATATATTTIVQTAFGIKPFSTFLGALKVRDDVDLEVALTLPSA
jgi:polyisoprenoid-binding protein YceI